MPRPKRKVESILQKKGFKLVSKDRDHDYFFVYINNKKTAVNTKVSRGSKKDIPDGLLSAMRREMNLEKNDFERYFNCTMTGEEYIAYLKEKNLIDSN